MPRLSIIDRYNEADKTIIRTMVREGNSYAAIGRRFNLDPGAVSSWCLRNGIVSKYAKDKDAIPASLLTPVTAAEGENSLLKPHSLQSQYADPSDLLAISTQHAVTGQKASIAAMKIIDRIIEIIDRPEPSEKTCAWCANSLDKSWSTYSKVNKLDSTNEKESDIGKTLLALVEKLDT